MFTTREAPADVLSALQQIDPDVTLRYIEDGVWMLAAKRPNREARRKLHREMKHVDEERSPADPTTARRFALLQMLANEGLRPIQLYEVDVPDHRIVKDFAERDRNWRNRAEDAFKENLERSMTDPELEARKARVRDFVESELPLLHAVIMRGRKSFSRLIPRRT